MWVGGWVGGWVGRWVGQSKSRGGNLTPPPPQYHEAKAWWVRAFGVVCVWAGPESVSWPAKCHFGTGWAYRGEHPSLQLPHVREYCLHIPGVASSNF